VTMIIYLLHETVDLGSHVVSAHKTREGAELAKERARASSIEYYEKIGAVVPTDFINRMYFIEEMELQE